MALKTLALLAFLLALAGCGPRKTQADTFQATPAPPAPPVELGAAGGTIASRANELAFDLLGRLEGDPLISPIGIFLALHMASTGAEGQTRREFERVLRTEGTPEPDLVASASRWLGSLRSTDPKVTLDVANGIFVRRGVTFEAGFLQGLQTNYQGEARSLDFARPEAVDEVNRWVSDQTRGRIRRLFDRFDPLTVLVLVNAVSFKGEWAKAFDPEQTVPQPFRSPSGSRDVPMMWQRDVDAECGEWQGARAIRLPFGAGRYAMVFVLPPEGAELGEWVASLDAGRWSDLRAGLKKQSATIGLPRFRARYRADLNSALKELGLRQAFEPGQADFRRARRQNDLFVQKVVHEAFLEVDEKGAEAAAATGVQIGVTSARDNFRFVADRPFFAAIEDVPTGALLFAGLVRDPETVAR